MISNNTTHEGEGVQCSYNMDDEANYYAKCHPNNRRKCWYKMVKCDCNKNLECLLNVLLIAAIVFILILMRLLALSVHNLDANLSSVHAKDSFGIQSASKGVNVSDIPNPDVCSYNTSDEFLETVIDDLSEYCKPRAKTKDLFDADMHQCSGNELYIPLQCMCDSKQQCPGENDISRKQKCETCMDERHCPCRNYGTCSKCIHGKVDCLCKQGTSGKYCTKITQRTCHWNTTITKTLHCNNSNINVCFIHESSNNHDYLCEWSVNLGQYPPCFTQRDEQDKHKQTVNADALTDISKDNEINKEETLLKTSKTLISISLTLTVIIFIFVILQLCRKGAIIRFKCFGQCW